MLRTIGTLDRTQLPRIALLATIAVTAAGCEPGAGDMLEAVKKDPGMRQVIKMTAVLGGSANPDQAADEALKTTVIEKAACAQAQGKPGYMCDFRIGMRMAGKLEYGPPGHGRFFKAGDGWRLEMAP